ncbi:Bug family tripartite tricarboxylate transporter substrate binding protein [Diaphorobacter caeni]|uniref:Bug family tripartite tricarboxylate transporter substrate binding protein n=1 Tax=Diaphorobacter caeni TaxID=2784387 RepID=UPI0018908A92|nr:tripartite tricarboxylate transporter substrate binding protein [Diaphorobacter caeni]MBF5007103.1 tripartite tricarboxylate transporter substrate binding protein [Diaphorobacter caeni]
MTKTALIRLNCRMAMTLAALSLLSAAPAVAFAQSYPSRPVKIVVPYPPGGTTDILGRILAEALGRQLGQPFVVENRNGSGGVVGANAVAKSAPDGYTLGIATVSTLATAPAAMCQIPYDPIHDFTPVVDIASVPNVLTINPGIPASNMAEFIALLKAHPGKYSFASSGTGGIAHMDGEQFKSVAGVDMVHVPYRGSAPGLTDTISGQVAAQFDNLSSSLAFIQSGKLRALAVASPSRVAELPDVPTYTEAGLPALNNVAWFGLVAPGKTPAEIIKKLNEAANVALKDPAVLAQLKRNGAVADGGSSPQFARRIEKELAMRKDIAKRQNIVLE